MPHIITNYSSNLNNLDSLQLLKDVNSVLLDTMLFSEHDIKSRIFKDQNFLIGVNGIQDAYIHLKLYLLSGRSEAQKKSLGELLLNILEQKNYLKSKIDFKIQLCVEVIDMPKENYFKSTV